MKKYKILKRGIPMRHGNIPREGFVFNDDGQEYYLLRHVGYSGKYYKYIGFWKHIHSSELCLCSGFIYVHTDDIVCYGEVVNEDGSERFYQWCDVSLFVPSNKFIFR